jgi:hypothetical protein
MFKAGDTVECVDNDNGKKSVTVGKQYEVLAAGPDSIRIKSDNGFKGSLRNDRFKLVGAIANSAPTTPNLKSVFSVGDRVRYIGKCYSAQGGLAQGATLTIDSLTELTKFAMATDDNRKQWSIGCLDTDNFTVVIHGSNPCAIVAAMEIKRVAELKPCTCDSMDLFRKGCGCGAIMKQKWGLQG